MVPISILINPMASAIASKITKALSSDEPAPMVPPANSDTTSVAQDTIDKPRPFNASAFRKGILAAEVSGELNYSAWNKGSSATGAYQIRYTEAKEWLPENGFAHITTREGFRDSPRAQEAYMDERIKRYVNKDAYDLTKRYKPQLVDKWNYTTQDIAALSHFLGRRGTMNYLAAIRDGRDPASVLPPHAINLPPDEYLRRFREGYESYFEE